MAAGQLVEAVRQLRRIVEKDDVAGMPDADLVRRYVRHHDEAAFEALVCRHGPLVLNVCRRVLRNSHDAEDAFQATFLVFVRKADTLRSPGTVANWLYGVAYRTALEARKTSAKRRTKERQMAEMLKPEATSPWHDLQPIFDRELSRLPDKYRVALVLCDLEGKTRKEAARQLGLPEGTVASRLARARAMLARRLGRHGIGLPAGALAALLSEKAASASVPTSLIASTIKAQAALAAGQAANAALLSAKVVALTEGVLKAMWIANLKVSSAVLAVAVLTTAMTAGIYAYPTAVEGIAPEKSPTAPHPTMLLLNSASDEPPRSDKEQLQGNWNLVKAELNGVEIPIFFQAKEGDTVVFAGDKWTTKSFEFMGAMGFSFKLDPTRNPKAIDLRPLKDANATLLGIYKLDGDDLKICCCQAGVHERPSSFAGYWKAGTYTGLIVLKRQREPVGAAKPHADGLPGAATRAWADKLFDTLSVDLGACPPGALIKYRFKMTNPWSVPLDITDVRTSCGCVTTALTHITLHPGETGYLAVTVDSSRFTGEKSMRIYVSVGPKFTSTATLTVRARHAPPQKPRPPEPPRGDPPADPKTDRHQTPNEAFWSWLSG
jgi:RNA polymerase sigma factor (sigma-70 family)